MNNLFCTIISKTRVYQFLSLYKSIRSNHPQATLFVLCIGQTTYPLLQEVLKNDKQVVLHKEEEIEVAHVKAIKGTRPFFEYCWTLKSIYVYQVLQWNPSADFVSLCDSDLYFYGNITEVLSKEQPFDVLLTPETRHPAFFSKDEIIELEKTAGTYNTGFVVFKNSDEGNKVANWWMNQCIKTVSVSFKDGVFADQKYADSMSNVSNGVKEITQHGVNVGPWNAYTYDFVVDNNRVNIHFNEKVEELILYHFHGFRMLDDNRYRTSYLEEDLLGYLPSVKPLYESYVASIKGSLKQIQTVEPGYDVNQKDGETNTDFGDELHKYDSFKSDLSTSGGAKNG